MEKLPKYQWDPQNIWLVVSTPLKNMKVIWGYYSQYDRKKMQMFQTTNQIPMAAYNIL